MQLLYSPLVAASILVKRLSSVVLGPESVCVPAQDGDSESAASGGDESQDGDSKIAAGCDQVCCALILHYYYA